MCMIEDCEPCELWDTVERKARKDHCCHECYRVIKKSENYIYNSFLSGGKFRNHKMCSHCSIAAKWLEKHCNGWPIGSISQDLIEHFGNGYKEDGIARLIVGMRRKWNKFSGGLFKVPSL